MHMSIPTPLFPPPPPPHPPPSFRSLPFVSFSVPFCPSSCLSFPSRSSYVPSSAAPSSTSISSAPSPSSSSFSSPPPLPSPVYCPSSIPPPRNLQPSPSTCCVSFSVSSSSGRHQRDFKDAPVPCSVDIKLPDAVHVQKTAFVVPEADDHAVAGVVGVHVSLGGVSAVELDARERKVSAARRAMLPSDEAAQEAAQGLGRPRVFTHLRPPVSCSHPEVSS